MYIFALTKTIFMKKIFTLLFCLTIGTICFAQQQTDSLQMRNFRKNDLTIDPFLLIGVPAINLSYERLINKNMGVGFQTMIDLSDELDINDQRFVSFNPYTRFYFGSRYATGFFVDTYLSFLGDHKYTNDTFSGQKKTISAGVGVAIGVKYKVKGIILEANSGIARQFINTNTDSEKIIPRWMFGIGLPF